MCFCFKCQYVIIVAKKLQVAYPASFLAKITNVGGGGYHTYQTPFGGVPGFHKCSGPNSHSVFQGVRDTIQCGFCCGYTNGTIQEQLFDEATSSKTDKWQTVFTETSMEATSFPDVSSLACQDCKVKTLRLKNLSESPKSENNQTEKEINKSK